MLSWLGQLVAPIARRQAADEDRAARLSGPILTCDTDVLATAVQYERYLGRRSGVVEAIAEARQPHRYVLTADDIPFVQDGLDGEHLRGWMTQRFRAVLDGGSVLWIEARRSRAERTEQVVHALANEFGEGRITAGPAGTR